MSHQISISFAGAILGIAGIVIVSTDAQAIVRTGGAYRGGVHAAGVYRGGVYRGGAYRTGVYRGGVYPGVGVGAAAGALAGGAFVAATSPFRWGSGYYYGYPNYAYPGSDYSGNYDPGYYSNYYYPSNAAAHYDTHCSSHFRSYDPATGTYLGHDGVRHPCP